MLIQIERQMIIISSECANKKFATLVQPHKRSKIDYFRYNCLNLPQWTASSCKPRVVFVWFQKQHFSNRSCLLLHPRPELWSTKVPHRKKAPLFSPFAHNTLIRPDFWVSNFHCLANWSGDPPRGLQLSSRKILYNVCAHRQQTANCAARHRGVCH